MIMCKGECDNWKVPQVTNTPFKEYYRCRSCQIWVKHKDCWVVKKETNRCPCCHGRVAFKPRLNERKREYMKKLGVRRYS
jgi:hypothetical protein